MSWVKKALEAYFAAPDYSRAGFPFGGGNAPGLEARLTRARGRSRAAFWVCVGMLLALFGAVLFVSVRHFDRLIELGPAKVSGVFGVSAGTCVTLMMYWAREAWRAEYLSVLLAELRAADPKEFVKITRELMARWYGLKAPAAEGR